MKGFNELEICDVIHCYSKALFHHMTPKVCSLIILCIYIFNIISFIVYHSDIYVGDLIGTNGTI